MTVLRLGVCAAGIYLSYLTQGLVQEDVSTRRYGPAQERFPALFLNLAQAVVCFLWAGLVLLVSPPPAGSARCSAFWRAGISNTLGPACGVLALKNIRYVVPWLLTLVEPENNWSSYAAQVLAKSCKLVPVMVAGALLHGKRHSGAEYFAALLIAGGVSLFAAVKNSGAVQGKLAAPNAPWGYLLAFLNLGLDGYTNASQDRVCCTTP